MQHWVNKFRNAARGIYFGIVGQSSFSIHIPAAMIVLLTAWPLRCSGWQFAVLGLCIALVMSLELMNSAIEYLAKGLCQEHNADVGKALDIASGAVALASLAAAAIGLAIFGYQGFIVLEQIV
jgi:diacylglycerol kinase